jgi:hypothetical protein
MLAYIACRPCPTFRHRVLACSQQQQPRPDPQVLEALQPLLVRPLHRAAARLQRKRLSMGLTSSRPAAQPPPADQHDYWRAEAKKHAEARNRLYQQSQVRG